MPSAVWVALHVATGRAGLIVSLVAGTAGIVLVGAVIGRFWGPRAATRVAWQMVALAVGVALSATALVALSVVVAWEAQLVAEAVASSPASLLDPVAILYVLYGSLQTWLLVLIHLGVPLFLGSLPLAMLWCWFVGGRPAGGVRTARAHQPR